MEAVVVLNRVLHLQCGRNSVIGKETSFVTAALIVLVGMLVLVAILGGLGKLILQLVLGLLMAAIICGIVWLIAKLIRGISFIVDKIKNKGVVNG